MCKRTYLTAFFLLFATIAHSATINVPADYSTIQDGINAAAFSGDTVLVAPGIYTENINFNLRNIVLISSDGPTNTILTPQYPDSLLVYMNSNHSGTFELSGFTCTGVTEGNVVHCEEYSAFASSKISNNIFHSNINYLSYDGVVNSFVIRTDNGGVKIYNNLFYNNGGLGCIRATGNCALINNTFHSNRIDILKYHSGAVINNIFSNATEANIVGDISGQIDYNNYWNSPTFEESFLVGEHNISVEPLYQDTINFDFRLRSNSLCINHGNPDTTYNDPNGSRADMGALPYMPAEYPYTSELFVEGRAIGGHVKSLTPTFSWSYFDTSFTSQTRFQIQVSSDNDWTIAELWNSGEISSSDSAVIYSGAVLNDLTEYFVRVRLHNGSQWGDWTHSVFNTILATTFYVPEDFLHIQYAIETAIDGDTIIVGPGTYPSDIDFLSKAIFLISSNGPRQTVVSGPWNNPKAINMLNITGGTAEVNGFTFSGPAFDGIVVNSCTDVRIINNIITSFGSFWQDGSSNSYPLTDGIECYDSRVYVKGNLFYNSFTVSSIKISGQSDSSQIINNTLVDNRIGLLIESDNITMLNNIITNSSVAGILVDDTVSLPYADYNLVWNNDSVGGVLYSDQAVPGLNDISLDPQYLYTEIGLFYIDTLSPCINSGHPDALYNDPDGSRNDRGFFPFGTIHPPSIPTSISIEEIFDNGLGATFILDVNPTLHWSPSTDLDSNDVIYYQLRFGSYTIDKIYDTFYTFIDTIPPQVAIQDIRLIAIDTYGLQGSSEDLADKTYFMWRFGDIDLDRSNDIGDLVYLVEYMFNNGPSINPSRLGDLDGNCSIDIADLVLQVGYQFGGAPYSSLQPGCE